MHCRKLAVGLSAQPHHSHERTDDAFDRWELTFQPYGKDEAEVINSIRALHECRVDECREAQGVAIRFDQRCIGFELKVVNSGCAMKSRVKKQPWSPTL